MDNEQLFTTLDRTGFMLEYKVQRILKAHGWHVLNNKYYIDDVSGNEREIDIVAYRFAEDHDYAVCTVLVISCKKASESRWVFMTNEHDPNDPYYENNPITLLSHQQDINCMLMYEPARLISDLLKYENAALLYDMPHRIFAYQQINDKSHKAEDDKRIFDSIITTIKAAHYEQKTFSKFPRNIKVAMYHMLSVFDGGLTEVYFDGTDQQVQNVQDIKYVGRHILSNQEASYKVHFIDSSAFDSILYKYDALSQEYAAFWKQQSDGFFSEPFSDEHKDRMSILWENFSYEFGRTVYDDRNDFSDVFSNTTLSQYSYDKENDTLTLYMDLFLYSSPSNLIVRLNQCEDVLAIAKRLLHKYFRYHGQIRFDYFISQI